MQFSLNERLQELSKSSEMAPVIKIPSGMAVFLFVNKKFVITKKNFFRKTYYMCKTYIYDWIDCMKKIKGGKTHDFNKGKGNTVTIRSKKNII